MKFLCKIFGHKMGNWQASRYTAFNAFRKCVRCDRTENAYVVSVPSGTFKAGPVTVEFVGRDIFVPIEPPPNPKTESIQ